jgi:GTP pyrophosphokinase
MLRFNDIADRMLEHDPDTDLMLLQKAYVFSAKVHEGQERLSGEPYLIHPLEVAYSLVEMRVDAETVAAAMLHDTLEDTLTTKQELEEIFGENVAFLVEGLTKIAKIEFKSARERQAENFRKMLIAMSTDIRILLIKLADRLHNMRTLRYMKEESRQRIAQETMDIYVPLAHRLGIYWMKQELEALAFRELHPNVVEELERQVSGSREEREQYVAEVIATISKKFAEAGLEAEVTGRLKELSSIHKKMQSQSLALHQIYDMIAFRAVLKGDDGSCYAALGLIHSMWAPVPGRFKDYVALPKPNGYKSLHTTVIGPYGERMEVQIRTEAMHSDAEFGIAAHWKYKEGPDAHAADERRFAWLRELLDRQRDVTDPHEFLDAVKMDLFPAEVFVFTPKGEVLNLPRGATALDFAYAIHTEVGNQCVGARVNGKQVPIRHGLQDGDTVEVQTDQHQQPRKDWLEFVVSSKARSNIRHSIRVVERSRAQQLGEDILNRELRRAGISIRSVRESGELAAAALAEIRDGEIDDLYAAISYGKVSASSVVRRLRGDGLAPERDEKDEPASTGRSSVMPTRLRKFFTRSRESSTGSGIRVSGHNDVLVRIGGCCDPLPGDEIVGFVTRGRGVTVHSRGCPRTFELAPERRIDVDWEEDTDIERRTKIRVTTKDAPGVLAKVTNAISSAGINIAGVKVTTDQVGQATQNFELWVGDARTLQAVMREIRRVKNVVAVDRVRS